MQNKSSKYQEFATEWGFLRETTAAAEKAGFDLDTGVCRTGLDKYLAVIFPEVDDWVHDKSIGQDADGRACRIRPDYRSDRLRLIIEFDGVQHYTDPLKIRKDLANQQVYERLGYRVVRIPYFIQLTNKAVETLFNRKVDIPLFDGRVPSMGQRGKTHQRLFVLQDSFVWLGTLPNSPSNTKLISVR